ncbi:DUF2470 domain-containing protein [Kitasatospora sp. NPDC052896]|uniref:DUF2470 domain-containing protein n=1 Tax=Kitasatospora sp. NPDC052896 TaxID=3364061 RepID=UPI0037CA654C
MGPADLGPQLPSRAGRACSMLAASPSLTVATDGHRRDLVGAHTLGAGNRLLLQLPAAHPLAAEVAEATPDVAGRARRGGLAAVVELTDVAPVAVRARVRARLVLAGWLHEEPLPTGSGSVRWLGLDLAQVSLVEHGVLAPVGLDELLLAHADPLARFEASLLLHLADCHQEVLAALARTACPGPPVDPARVLPLALDQHGLSLRREGPVGHQDLRVPFRRPATAPEQVGERIREVLARPIFR